MKYSLTFYLFCLLLISLCACRKDSYFEDKDTIISPPTVFYLISISGIVTNSINKPVEGAELFIGEARVVTDRNGAYLFRSIRVPEDVTVMNIKASGYESRTTLFLPEKGKWLRQDVQLHHKQHTASFNNADGITLEFEKQARLEIPANAIQLFSGAPYNGEVKILAEFLDPNNVDHMTQTPGIFLTGKGLGNKRSILSHGVLHVRLETPGGMKLKLKQGSTASFKAPVLNALLQQSDLGANVWYFNETNGNWNPGAVIQRKGSFFETTITELSWITYGKSIECVWLSGNIENFNKIAYNQSPLEIKVGEFYQNRIIPGADGRFRFLAPKHNSVKLRLTSHCNSLIYSRDFNSLTADTTDLGIIRVSPQTDQTTISGSFNFCSGKNHNAYLLVQTGSGNMVLFPNSQNVFSGIVDRCSSMSQIKVSIVNASVGKESAEATLPDNKVHYDLGKIELCDENDIMPSYAYLSLGNKTYFSTITDASLKKIDDLSLHEYELNVSSMLKDRELEFQFIIFDLVEGFSLNPNSGFKISGSEVQLMACNLPSTSCDLELIISDYHGPGSKVKGTFRGSAFPIEFEGGFNIRVVEKR